MQIRTFLTTDTETVIKLWNDCELTRPWNNPYLDIQRKLSVRPDWFVVGEVDGKIVSSAMFGYEGHRGWVNYLAVSPAYQKRGYARQLMKYGEELMISAGCPKINLLVRTSNKDVLAFYAALGYKTDDAVCLGKRLIPDE